MFEYPDRDAGPARIALALLAFNSTPQQLDSVESTLQSEADAGDEDAAAALNELLIARQAEVFEL